VRPKVNEEVRVVCFHYTSLELLYLQIEQILWLDTEPLLKCMIEVAVLPSDCFPLKPICTRGRLSETLPLRISRYSRLQSCETYSAGGRLATRPKNWLFNLLISASDSF
jgi:hypothetical protein